MIHADWRGRGHADALEGRGWTHINEGYTQIHNRNRNWWKGGTDVVETLTDVQNGCQMPQIPACSGCSNGSRIWTSVPWVPGVHSHHPKLSPHTCFSAVLCPSDKRAHAFGYFILNYKFYLRVLKPTSGFPPLQPPAHRGGRQINSLETVGSAPSLPRIS